MEQISKTIGQRIRRFRKRKNITLVEFAEKVYKSKATVSKYESGEINIDIPMLYEIAGVLNVEVGQLLPECASVVTSPEEKNMWLKKQGKNSRLYSYFYDGRSKCIVKCILEFQAIEDESTNQSITIYMNIKNYDEYQNCENIYRGKAEYFDSLTNIYADNIDTDLEKIHISILSSFLNTPYKFGLMFGISFRPIMPAALKMLFSSEPIIDERELVSLLKISKEDIRIEKMYNMFSVM
ncbi:helix-turn-helix domain-containing protein [Companilactobacillus keshanensis]|uniref:Helix-turn-helix domain-containing protein n=1 Tax=Companilactobacillus keshanensis TaxID=2486003 RepID=A0ABW4BSK3_9LACO|nr:helix-turn-helix transcriptional regulator [Companilactobacillus keshanensis]